MIVIECIAITVGVILFAWLTFFFRRKLEAEKMNKIWNRLNLEKGTKKDAY